jgi:hypothetical protein
MLRIFTLLFSLFYYIHSYGIQGYNINFKNIDNRQGLSQNGITSIFQDRDGYMWFGTHYGLNRYDGLNIKSYYAGNSPNQLSDNIISSIVQDLAGNIWIATEQGLTVFNPITQKFYNLKKYNSKNSLFSQNIQSIKLIDGKIMITSLKGLWSINPGRILFTDKNTKSICENAIHYKMDYAIKSEFFKFFKKDKNDSYWFTTKNEVILAKPARWRKTVSMKTNGQPILIRSQDFIAQYQAESDPATPKYYADYDYNNWAFAPAPDTDYSIEIIYYSKIQPLDTTNQQNLFTRECPQAMLFGTLLQAQGYLKALDKLPVWKQYYEESLASLKKEDNARRVDRNTSIQEP